MSSKVNIHCSDISHLSSLIVLAVILIVVLTVLITWVLLMRKLIHLVVHLGRNSEILMVLHWVRVWWHAHVHWRWHLSGITRHRWTTRLLRNHLLLPHSWYELLPVIWMWSAERSHLVEGGMHALITRIVITEWRRLEGLAVLHLLRWHWMLLHRTLNWASVLLGVDFGNHFFQESFQLIFFPSCSTKLVDDWKEFLLDLVDVWF